jgi:hypothetical protein
VLSQWIELTGANKINFIFIKGSHQFLDLLKNFELSFPLLKEDGWIAFHDVVPTWPGSERVWHNIAKHCLVNHEYSSTLACGQKKSTVFASPLSLKLGSFSENFKLGGAIVWRSNLGILEIGASASASASAGKTATPRVSNGKYTEKI